jgi:hypothetical protein
VTDQATLERRYPWSKYQDPKKPPYLTGEQSTDWHIQNCPFSVRWTVPDPTPGLYGWRCESRMFATEAEALAAAEQSMGIARDVEVIRWDWDKAPQAGRATQIYSRKNRNTGKRR